MNLFIFIPTCSTHYIHVFVEYAISYIQVHAASTTILLLDGHRVVTLKTITSHGQ